MNVKDPKVCECGAKMHHASTRCDKCARAHRRGPVGAYSDDRVSRWAEGKAASLRANPSPHEAQMAKILDGHGISYERQVVIGGRYIADFLIGQVDLEVDHGDRRRRNAARDAAVESLGYEVVRVDLTGYRSYWVAGSGGKTAWRPERKEVKL